MRNDNYIYFTDTNGKPQDEGSKDLESRYKLPKLSNLKLYEPHTTEVRFKVHIIIPIRENNNINLLLSKEILSEIFEKISQIITTRDLDSISIAKTRSIEYLEWKDVFSTIKKKMEKLKVTVTVCLGKTKDPELTVNFVFSKEKLTMRNDN